MKRKILVLDAFTNGHEAAQVLIKRQGWYEEDCELVFCGTHHNVIQKLTEGPAYAVLPIHNSIAKEVTEVVKDLSQAKETGYSWKEIDRFDLQVNHCLLVPQHIQYSRNLERIISHEKAIQQCGEFLNSIGITEEKRSKKDSTGNAAKAVSRMGPAVMIGAIASKAAAVEYKLKILAENIQDAEDNRTTFILLENDAEVRRVTVGIIGIKGHFGQLFKDFFEKLGCHVIGAGRSLSDQIDVVNSSEVIIFSVPISVTPAVIRLLVPYIRPDQLIMDVTSIKQPAVQAMLESNAQVVGLHPMFRPEVPFDGQTIVACPARLTDPAWKTWVVNMLTATGSSIKWSTAAEHDNYMTTIQVIPHLGNLTSALLITEAGKSVTESLAFTSPFYRVMFSLMGRLVSQSPDLYTSIVMENPETVTMLEKRIAIEERLLQMIREKDQKGFENLFRKAKEHFGVQVTREANELFMRILAVLSTLYGKNSVTLEFTKSQSRPGLLEEICRVFTARHINLTGINSVTLDGQRIQFTISFEQSGTSQEVRKALHEIENWHEPKVRVVE
jgi:prephenate dehydrogenase